eukprot:CAMPEP_0170198220 /NCGR_PEP_ID=MMETSP0040_2-20121228/68302_1 /TAXON_ID=641309 /ORGANISM="Lotharella oceanica, Strain CCMP622" /LENGTH=188 /DNA_ID=CAMNT_0010448113 /DNA_START=878 /DNA_END=1444 /DNA_ORIENTATION=+
MAEVESQQQLVHVVLDVVGGQAGEQGLEVAGIHVLEHEAFRLRQGVHDGVQQADDVLLTRVLLIIFPLLLILALVSLGLLAIGTPHILVLRQVPENQDLPPNLLLLHWLENFDHHWCLGAALFSLEYIAVFPSSYLPYDLVVIRAPPSRFENAVIPVCLGFVLVDVFVDSRYVKLGSRSSLHWPSLAP